ncbi:recombination protein RecR, partial [Klebsiella pneumoniae]|nr:recombination protein RecR [Klebsiella pneumoniae]
MAVYEGPVQVLIDELGRLPGVGPKSAQRIAFHLLKIAPEDARRLADAIVDVKLKVSWCRRCFNIAEGELCSYCR